MPVRRLLAAACLLPLALPPAGAAEEPGAAPDPLRLSGFATLGLTHSDNADAGLAFSHSQKQPVYDGLSAKLDSVLGLQLDWQAAPDTSLAVQGVARAGSRLEPELRMAYLRQQLSQDVALRLGRIRSPLYFDSDVAEIGYAYLMVRQPMPLYAQVNGAAAIDGADLQWRHAAGNAAFLLQASVSSTSYQRKLAVYNSETQIKWRKVRSLALNVNLPYLTARASRTWIGDYELHGINTDQLNDGLNRTSASLQLAGLPALARQVSSFINPLNGPLTYSSAGFDSTVNDWRFMGEWTQTRSYKALVGNYRGYQLTTAYNLRDCTPYFSVARLDRRSDALDTSALAATGVRPDLDRGVAILKGVLDAAGRYSNLSTRSVSLGVRYDFQENKAFKLQYDWLKTPNAQTPGIFEVTHLPIRNRVSLISATLDMVF